MKRKAFLMSLIMTVIFFSIAAIFAAQDDWLNCSAFIVFGNIGMVFVVYLWKFKKEDDLLVALFSFFAVNFVMNPAGALPPQAVVDYKPCLMFTATTTWQKLKSSDIYRKYILIQNQAALGGDNIRIEMMASSSAPVGSVGLLLGPGGNYEFFIPPWNNIWVKAETSTAEGCLVEGQ